MEIRRLPIGEQSFEKIRNEKNVYVDKTALMYKLANSSTYTFLSRPRRFGKSLLTSTLEAYFQGQKELFAGLAIEKLENNWKQHTVLHFDFANRNYSTDDPYFTRRTVTDVLSPFEQKYNIDFNEKDDLGRRFEFVIRAIANDTKLGVVILIDEYDKPLLTNIEQGKDEPSRISKALVPFFTTLKTMDKHIRFAFITGVTKFSKLSLFSGLNNLKDISLDEPYSTICGFTQEELEKNFTQEINRLAKKRNLTYTKALDKLKHYYNGYDFTGDGIKVYNPFSTLNCFMDSKFGEYWFTSGTPSFLIEKIKTLENYDLADLENGIRMSVRDINEYNPSPSYPASKDPNPLLFQTGYLTIKRKGQNERLVLGYPNMEVQIGFERALINYFTQKTSNIVNMSGKLVEYLETEKLDEFFLLLKTLYNKLPYDLNNKTEKHFSTIFYVALRSGGIDIKAEQHFALGSADAVVFLDDQIYIFEFKLADDKDKIDPQTALKQINEKGYATQYEQDTNETRKIIKVGVVFSKDKRNVAKWKAE